MFIGLLQGASAHRFTASRSPNLAKGSVLNGVNQLWVADRAAHEHKLLQREGFAAPSALLRPLAEYEALVGGSW
ncbi:hypothetical protein NKH60_30715 [Mesorhizobium sp. M1006]|uniref:hypothetical protein n=1 Tax=Mesorhizobium sp. M1006 TaxID=2957048 RepID=UPI00333DED3A